MSIVPPSGSVTRRTDAVAEIPGDEDAAAVFLPAVIVPVVAPAFVAVTSAAVALSSGHLPLAATDHAAHLPLPGRLHHTSEVAGSGDERQDQADGHGDDGQPLGGRLALLPLACPPCPAHPHEARVGGRPDPVGASVDDGVLTGPEGRYLFDVPDGLALQEDDGAVTLIEEDGVGGRGVVVDRIPADDTLESLVDPDVLGPRLADYDDGRSLLVEPARTDVGGAAALVYDVLDEGGSPVVTRSALVDHDGQRFAIAMAVPTERSPAALDALAATVLGSWEWLSG